MAIATEELAVRTAVEDYVEGWFDGDAARMRRALHPELIKRRPRAEGEDGDPLALRSSTAQQMIEATAKGAGRREDAGDREIDVTITQIGDGIASATCVCHRYVDLLHLVRTPDGWRIVHALWQRR